MIDLENLNLNSELLLKYFPHLQENLNLLSIRSCYSLAAFRP